MSFIARDYQTAAVQSVLKQIEAGSKGTLCAMATGTGKTGVAGLLAMNWERLLFIVDREELAFQAKDALQGITGRPVALECGTDYKAYRTAPNAKMVVAMSQSMIRRLRHYSQDRFEYIMEDECFPAGTPVDGKPIETLVAGDSVSSFNHDTEQAEQRKVLRVSSRKPNGLVRVILRSGRSFVCTPCHPVFALGDAKSGGDYIRAAELNSTHSLLRIPVDGRENETFQHPLHGMRIDRDGISRNAFTTSGFHGKETLSGVLLRSLYEEKHEANTLRKHGENKYDVCERSNERTKSDAFRGDTKESVEVDERKKVRSARRKWNRDECSSGKTKGSFAGIDSRSSGRIHHHDTSSISNAAIILARFGVSDAPSMHRDRWEQSLSDSTTGTRSSERQLSSLDRVERVEVLEPTSDGTYGGMCPDGLVYNLEVDGNHNYFVDGVLVHNCHHSPAATRTAIRNHFTGSKAVIGFSATPKRADGKAQGLVYDTVAYEMDIVTSLDLGWLTPFQSRVLSCNELDLKEIDVTCGELNKKQLIEQYEKQALVERIANRTVAIADGRQTVIFAQSVEQSKQIDRYLKSIGEKSVHVDGKLPRFVRRDRLAAFGVGQYRYIVNCNLIEEGVDVPGIEVVAMASAMRSSVRFIQRCGRGLRPVCELSHESAAIRRKEIADSRKPHCTIIDFIGQMDDHCSSMCFAGDLLGGEFDDETRKVAIRMAADRENPDIPSILREAKEIVEKRKKNRSARDIKMEVVNRWRSSRIEEQNWAVNTKFCPYDVLKLRKSDAEAQVTKDEMYGRSYSASESYLKACQLKQSEISSLTSKEVVYLARVLRNRATTHCSYVEARAIHARGYDASNLTKAQGNELYDKIKAAGFVRPPEDGPNELYVRHKSKSEQVQNFTFL